MKCFKPETLSGPRGILPQNFSLLGSAVLKDLWNKKQTHRHRFYHRKLV